MKQNQEDGPGNLNRSEKECKKLVDTEDINFRIKIT